MPSSILNSDDGVISGTSGLKSSGGDDGALAVQSNGTELAKFKTTELVINDGGANYDFRVEGDGNANLVFVDASTDRVGLGTNTPAERLDVAGNANIGNAAISGATVNIIASTASQIYGYIGATLTGTFGYVDATQMIVGSQTNIPYIMRTNATERARITNGGIFCSGRTTAIDDANSAGAGNFQAVSTALEVYRTSTSTNTMTQFFSDEGSTKSNRFQFRCNGGLANYQANDANLSDRREKTDFAPSKNYLDTICSIPVQTFKYIGQSDNELTLGVVAQDVQEVAPELVSESNWGTQEEPKMRLSIYQTDLQYALMKCIQELKAELDEAKARIAALEQA